MKFVCEHCRTQYLVSDEKIGSRGVKVRCKRCSNVIVLQPDGSVSSTLKGQTQSSEDTHKASMDLLEQNSEEKDELGQVFDKLLKGGEDRQESADGEISSSDVTQLFDPEDLKRLHSQMDPVDEESLKIDQMFAAAESTSIGPGELDKRQKLKKHWYIASEGQQEGPLSLEELEGRVLEGRIDANTYVWYPGLPDWVIMQDVSELEYLLEARGHATDTGFTGDSTDKREWLASSDDSSLSDLVQQELRAVKSLGLSGLDQDSGSHDSFVSGSIQDERPWVEGMTGKGQDGGFFDSSIEQTNSCPDGDNEVRANGFLDRQLARPAYLSEGSKHRKFKRGLLVGSFLVFLLVVSAAVYRFVLGGTLPFETFREQKPPSMVQKQAVRVESQKDINRETFGKADYRPAGQAKGIKADQDRKDDSSGSDKETKKNLETTKRSGIMVASASAKVNQSEAHSAPNRATDNKPAGSKQKNQHESAKKRHAVKLKQHELPKSRKRSKSSSKNLRDSLSKEQIYAVMKQSIPAMKGCVKQQLQRNPSIKGTLLVSFVIKPSGKVGTVTTLSKEHRGTYVSECISYIIKEMKFPKFSGDPITVPRVPLTIGH